MIKHTLKVNFSLEDGKEVHYLKLSDFRDLGYQVEKVRSYTMEEIMDGDDMKMAIVLKFYDKDGKLVVPKK